MLKLREAIFGDYRKEEVKEAIQVYLKKIPALSHYEDDVPFEVLEQCIHKLRKKYGVVLQYIMHTLQPDGDPYFSTSFKRQDNYEWVGTVSSRTLYEALAKGVLLVYSYGKKHDSNIH